MNPTALVPTQRPQDSYGSGAIGAARGSRKHLGIDYLARPGEGIVTLRAGVVTKIGYPYSSGVGSIESSDPLRYVQLTSWLKVLPPEDLPEDGSGVGSHQKVHTRIMYIQPEVHLHQSVPVGARLGVLQDLRKRYPGEARTPGSSATSPILTHYHLESRFWDSIRSNWTYINPETLRVLGD